MRLTCGNITVFFHSPSFSCDKAPWHVRIVRIPNVQVQSY